MSQETLNTILAGIAAASGLVTIYLSVKHHLQRTREREEDRRLAEQQLALAEEQAKLHPSLEVTLPDGQVRYQRPIPIPEGYVRDGYLLFEVKNAGVAAAHNVECKFEFDSGHLDLLGSASFTFGRLPSLSPQLMQVNVRPQTHGPSKASYTCTYDEGMPVTSTIAFENPNPEGSDLA